MNESLENFFNRMINRLKDIEKPAVEGMSTDELTEKLVAPEYPFKQLIFNEVMARNIN